MVASLSLSLERGTIVKHLALGYDGPCTSTVKTHLATAWSPNSGSRAVHVTTWRPTSSQRVLPSTK